MCLIKIFGDVHNITQRVKEIDDGYYVVYNTKKQKYEIHNKNQTQNTFCITVPTPRLDARTIVKLRETRIENIEKLMQKIEKENQALEKEEKRKIKDSTDWKVREMFNYAKSHIEDVEFSNTYSTKWA